MSSKWYYVMVISGVYRVVTTPPAPGLEIVKLGIPFHLKEKINCSYDDIVVYTDDRELAEMYANTYNSN